RYAVPATGWSRCATVSAAAAGWVSRGDAAGAAEFPVSGWGAAGAAGGVPGVSSAAAGRRIPATAGWG
ncbi:hypothetical protein V497_05555, partial [Pseudogymnoascus sp. VKM F-4516 (FW-969)]